MPGRNEQQAVTNFLEPLQRALSVLDGHGQITTSRKGKYRKGQLYAWELNGGDGMAWPEVGRFTASMNFEIVDADPDKHDVSEGRFRITTHGYWYTFNEPGEFANPRWRLHWHPSGHSYVTEPHLHLPPDLGKHWPTPRMSLEMAIRWCMVAGAPTSCTQVEADNRLTETEATYKLFGSWQQTTDAGYPYPELQPGQ